MDDGCMPTKESGPHVNLIPAALLTLAWATVPACIHPLCAKGSICKQTTLCKFDISFSVRYLGTPVHMFNCTECTGDVHR